MQLFDIIIATATLLALLLCSLMMSGDVVGMVMAWVANPILRKLGLQGNCKQNTKSADRSAKVIVSGTSELRVELDGTSWKAELADPDWIPRAGETVRVEGVNGLTVRISRERKHD